MKCLFAHSAYLNADPFKVGGDIPMPVPLRASVRFTLKIRILLPFLPWTTSPDAVIVGIQKLE